MQMNNEYHHSVSDLESNSSSVNKLLCLWQDAIAS